MFDRCAQVEELKAELRALTLVHEKYQTEAQERIRELMDKVSELKSSVSQLEEQHAHEQQNLLKLKSELDQCREEAKSETERLQSELAQKCVEIDSLSAQLDHARSMGAKELEKAQAAKGRCLAGVVAAHQYAKEIEEKSRVAAAFRGAKDAFFQSQVGGMGMHVVSRLGFSMARWVSVHEAAAIAQWRDRVRYHKMLSVSQLVPDWYTRFEDAKEKLAKLRHQQVSDCRCN